MDYKKKTYILLVAWFVLLFISGIALMIYSVAMAIQLGVTIGAVTGQVLPATLAIVVLVMVPLMAWVRHCAKKADLKPMTAFATGMLIFLAFCSLCMIGGIISGRLP